jgi:hypothetical protein
MAQRQAEGFKVQRDKQGGGRYTCSAASCHSRPHEGCRDSQGLAARRGGLEREARTALVARLQHADAAHGVRAVLRVLQQLGHNGAAGRRAGDVCVGVDGGGATHNDS